MKRTFIVVALIAAIIAPIWAQTSGTTPDGFHWSRNSNGNGILIDAYDGTTTTVRIPERINNLPVVEILDQAFKGNTRITSVTIPNSVTYIGGEAFMGCANLTSVTLSSSLTEIHCRAFSGCAKLTSITLPTSIRAIAGGAFFNCSALTTINIPDSVTSITFGIETYNVFHNASILSTNQFSGTGLNDASRQRLVNRGYTGRF